LSLRYPSSWKTELAQQQPTSRSGAAGKDGRPYRYFVAPGAGAHGQAALSVTLIAEPLALPLDQYAQAYLAGQTVASARDESRPGARGKSYVFASADRTLRHALLLLEERAESRFGLPPAPAPRPPATPPPGTASLTLRPTATPTPTPPAAAPATATAWVYGLHAQGDSAAFDAQRSVVDEMLGSLALERTAQYPEERNEKFAFAIRVPPSWPSARTFSSGTTFLQQYTSPAFGAEKRETVHASLTVSVEAIGADGTVDTYYKSTMDKLGDAFAVLSHAAWHGGYVDVLHSETGIAESRGKRFYRAADGRGYALAFDARDDIYPRVSRWCDMIAATLKVGSEVKAP